MIGLSAILAHNPGGSLPYWLRLPLPVLAMLPISLLAVAVVLIVKKRNLAALFAILGAFAAGILALCIFFGSIF